VIAASCQVTSAYLANRPYTSVINTMRAASYALVTARESFPSIRHRRQVRLCT
jgi:hypothetical protein